VIQARQNAISYFREKTEVAIALFRQEQMFVVEQYYKMRKEKKADDIKIMRLSKQVTT
jgi:hypothetical protein